ncbi:hypothetical protein UlMin_032417 [Ulmus minor]
MAKRRSNPNSGTSIMALPLVILVDILLKLSTKSIVYCKCVCKTWRAAISDPQFAKMHFKQAKAYPLIRDLYPTRISRTLYLNEPGDGGCDSCNIEVKVDTNLRVPIRNSQVMIHQNKPSVVFFGKYRPGMHCIKINAEDHRYHLVNSCNGLLCLAAPSKCPAKTVVVCNPVTGEYINLWSFPNTLPFGITKIVICCGLGFCSKSNQFKVVRVCHLFDRGVPSSHKIVMAEIQALGTGEWRDVDNCPGMWWVQEGATYLDGALHWMCIDYQESEHIVSFDLENEQFYLLPLPPLAPDHPFKNEKVYNLSMGAVGGCLCVCDPPSSYLLDEPCDVWIMKYYGVHDSWTKLFSIASPILEMNMTIDPHANCCFPISLDNGAFLMFYSSEKLQALVYYDQRGLKLKHLKLRPLSKFQAIAHTPSFIPLKDMLMVGDNVEILNVNSGCGNLKLLEETYPLTLGPNQ